jgi:16S rRNA (guanine966-N2)-methyltransferase
MKQRSRPPTGAPAQRQRAPTSQTAGHSGPGRLRIIGGRWRGSRIEFPPLPGIRPSPDRVRETLFNWLQRSIVGASCLDLFAGSGALGIEALSRGAREVVLVDCEAQVERHLRATLQRFRAENFQVVRADAMRYLAGPPTRFDLVFLDPPFAAGLLPRILHTLHTQPWLTPGALIYVEAPANEPLPMWPQGWVALRSKQAGQVSYHLLRARAESSGTGFGQESRA